MFVVGTTAAKEITVARLGIERAGPGFCHFPADRDFDYFEMLLAERPVRKFVHGVPVRLWVKAPSARNESLDARIYSLAALHALRSYGFDLDRAAERAARSTEAAPSKRPQDKTWADFAKLQT